MVMQRFILFLGLMFTASVAAEQVILQNLRIWSAPYSTRVVFDISEPLSYRLSMFSDPPRLAIDIDKARISRAVEQAIQRPISSGRHLVGIRSGHSKDAVRIVFDLRRQVKSQDFLLPPNKRYGNRLVIDLDDERAPQMLTARDSAAGTDGTDGARDILIAIDAGHGGEDPGAIGRGGLQEKEVTLKVARRLAQLINDQRGMRALLVREGDYFVRLRDRVKKARENAADLFVSIHADAFKDRRVKGASVYILSTGGASSESARWLAEQENAADLIGGVSLDNKDDQVASVLLDLSQTASLEASQDVAGRVLASLKGMGRVHRKHVQSAGFVVLKSPDIPSLLVEMAYISNPSEEKRLARQSYQDKLSRAIFNGLKSYFEDRPPAGTMFAGLAHRRHTIVRGDTLSGIARQYRVSMSSLRRINHLQGDRIRAGQVLKIPAT